MATTTETATVSIQSDVRALLDHAFSQDYIGSDAVRRNFLRFCRQRSSHGWLITHEHISCPFEFNKEGGNVVMSPS
jgi:hypothetical protein